MKLLFDIGGTRTRLAYSTDGQSFSAPVIIATPQDFDEAMAAIQTVVADFQVHGRFVRAAGGAAGPLSKDRDTLVRPPNLPKWHSRPLKKTLERIVGCSVKLENDSAVVGLGEAVAGAGAGYGIVAYLGVGTGVGGARIVKQRIDASAHGFEPGHQIVSCADRQTLESLIGGRALADRTGQEPWTITDESVWQMLAGQLAVGVYNTLLHWSPDVVVIGGAMVTKKPGISLDVVQRELERLNAIIPELPPILPATLGSVGGLYGALALATKR